MWPFVWIERARSFVRLLHKAPGQSPRPGTPDENPAARLGSSYQAKTPAAAEIDAPRQVLRSALQDAAVESPRRGRGDAGEYRLLHKYLAGRFADRLVLTFSQIEDLVGFSLPESARLRAEWWGTSHASEDRTTQSDAWTLAHRTASVNLPAQCVTFERI